MDDTKLEQAILQTHCRWELSSRFVKMTANYHKINNLNNESTNFLALDCTYQLFALIGCAKKIAYQSRRTHLKASDIISALKLCSFGHLYGHYSQMNYQIQTLNHANTRLKGLMTYVDKEFDLESFLSQPPLKLPREIVVHGHWLSINGEIPDIDENIPQVMPENVQILEAIESGSNLYTHNHNDTNRLNVNNRTRDNSHNPSIQNSSIFSDRIPLLIERQLIYKELTEACFGQNETKRKEALNIMSSDLVMKELAPHFASFIRESVKLNIKRPNLGILLNCVRAIKAILDNHKLKPEFIQNHLHYFIPSLLNCIISRQICVKPESENHWALRCFASKTLANVCATFQLSIPSLSLRVCNVAKRVIKCTQFPLSKQNFLNDDRILDTDHKIADLEYDENLENDCNDDLSQKECTSQHNEEQLNKTMEIPDEQTNLEQDIEIDNIPFSSYYGAATLLFDISPSITKLTTLPLLPKLGHLIDITLKNCVNNEHSLAKMEAEQLRDLLIRQGKFIIRNFFTTPYILDSYITDYGSYLGELLYNEVNSSKGSNLLIQQPPVSPTLSSEKQNSLDPQENKHVL